MNLTIFKQKKMNLTIAPFSRPVVVVWAQVLVSRVRILWWVRILVRFGRTGPVPRVSGPVRFDQNDPLTRDSGELRQIRRHIRNLRKKLGHIGLVGSIRVFMDRVTVRFGISDRAEPVRESAIPNRARNSGHKNPNRPGPTLWTQRFVQIPNLRSDLT